MNPPGPRSRPWLLVAAAALLVTAPRHARAQQYGQWSWNGTLGLGQRSYDNSDGLGGRTEYDEKELRLSLGLNGFVLSPAVAGFQLGADVRFLRIEDPDRRNTVQWGGRGSLSILPLSSVPVQLYARHARYDFGREEQRPVFTAGTPDYGTALGGRVRLRRGPLTGLLAGYDWSSLSFAEPGSRDQGRTDGFLDWVAPLKGLRPHVRLERITDDYSQLSYSTRDWIGTYDHSGPVLGAWRWQLSAVGIDREATYEPAAPITTRTARLQTNLNRPVGTRGTLSLDYGFGYGSTGSGGSAVDHVGAIRYFLRAGSGVTVEPNVGWVSSRSGAYSSDGPRAGLNLSWSGRSGPWSSSVTLGGDAYQQRQTVDGHESTWRGLGGSAGLSVAHEGPSALRQELVLAAATSQFRPVGAIDPEVPELGEGTLLARLEDRVSGRLTVSAPFGSTRTAIWGELERRRPTEGTSNPVRYTVDRATASLTVTGGLFNASVSAGTSRLVNGTDEQVDYAGGALSVRPLSWLALGGSYRYDRRTLVAAPDVDAFRAEGYAEVSVGAFRLRGSGFRAEEKVADGARRVNQGFTWSLFRAFEGWLPFLSAPPRRGVVR